VVGVRLDLEAPSIIGSTACTGPRGPTMSALRKERETQVEKKGVRE